METLRSWALKYSKAIFCQFFGVLVWQASLEDYWQDPGGIRWSFLGRKLQRQKKMLELKIDMFWFKKSIVVSNPNQLMKQWRRHISMDLINIQKLAPKLGMAKVSTWYLDYLDYLSWWMLVASDVFIIVWLVVWNIFYFPKYIGNNHPNRLIFFRGVQTTNQYIFWCSKLHWLVPTDQAFRWNHQPPWTPVSWLDQDPSSIGVGCVIGGSTALSDQVHLRVIKISH